MQQGILGRVQAPISNAGAFPGCYALVYINRFSVRGNGTDQMRILQLAPGASNFLNDGLGNQGQFGVVAGGSSAPRAGGDYRFFVSVAGNTCNGQIMVISTEGFYTFNDGYSVIYDIITE